MITEFHENTEELENTFKQIVSGNQDTIMNSLISINNQLLQLGW